MNKKYKFVTVRCLLLYLIVVTGPFCSVRAFDFLVIEALIQTHKAESNRLKKRMGLDVATLGLTATGKHGAESFGTILQTLSNRSGGTASMVAFAAELTSVSTLANQVIAYEKKTVHEAVRQYYRSPMLADKGVELHKEFGEMLTRITNQSVYLVTSGVGITLATQEQRQAFVGFLVAELKAMRDKFRAFDKFMQAFKHLTRQHARGGYEEFKDKREALIHIWEDVFHEVKGRVHGFML